MTEEKKSGESIPDSSDQPKKFSSFFRRKKSEAENLLARQQEKNDLDKKLVLSLTSKDRRWPTWLQLRQIGSFLTTVEKRIIKLSFLVIGLSLLFWLGNFWFLGLKIVPANGGEYSEGLLGSPQYLNPVLAHSDVDLDINSLIYSGLLRRSSRGLENDLVESYQISDDQKDYTFVLKKNIYWPDGDAVTANDVVFTFDLIKNPEVGSSLFASFKGITLEKIDDYSFKFVLKEPYAPFLGTLTFGILPEHLWNGIAPANLKLAEFNLKPVGCGPFVFESLKKDASGSIRSLSFVANKNYYAGRPYLDRVVFKFYSDLDSLEQALNNKNVTAVSYLPVAAKDKIFGGATNAKGFNLFALDFPQYSAIFFNQNNAEPLKDKLVRQALYQAIDRPNLLSQVLEGEGKVINGPILPGFLGYRAEVSGYDYSLEAAGKLLEQDKWQKISSADYFALQREAEKKYLPEGQTLVDKTDEERSQEVGGQQSFYKKDGKILQITLTVVDLPEPMIIAKAIQIFWRALGVNTIIQSVRPENIRRDVIKTRNYQALLYSEVLGYDPDPYPFWHSSQIADPGLNLALFSNRQADKYIETARQNNDAKVRDENYQKFQDILNQEIPAIFLYSPSYLYVVGDKIKGLEMKNIFMPADRLSDMAKRYLTTKKSWK